MENDKWINLRQEKYDPILNEIKEILEGKSKPKSLIKNNSKDHYFKILRDRVIFRKNTPQENQFLLQLDPYIIEEKVAKLAGFPEADLKYLEIIFEKQIKISERNFQYIIRMLTLGFSVFGYLLFVSYPGIAKFVVPASWFIFYHYSRKSKLDSGLSVSIELLKEAQLLKSSI